MLDWPKRGAKEEKKSVPGRDSQGKAECTGGSRSLCQQFVVKLPAHIALPAILWFQQL